MCEEIEPLSFEAIPTEKKIIKLSFCAQKKWFTKNIAQNAREHKRIPSRFAGINNWI